MIEQDTAQTSTHDRGASALFPDTDAETYAEAQRLADVCNAQFAAAHASEVAGQEPSDVKRPLTCDADDVLLAGYLTEFGQAMMRNPATRTKAMHRLYDSNSVVGPRCLIGLAKALRRMHGASLPIEQASLDFTATLTAVLVAVAPDQRSKFGKHPGG